MKDIHSPLDQRAWYLQKTYFRQRSTNCCCWPSTELSDGTSILQAFGKEIYHVAFCGIWAQPLKAKKCSTDQESHSSRKCLPGAGQQPCVAFITSPRSWIRTLMTLKPGLIFKSKLAKCPKVEHIRLSIASKAALSKCQACYNLPRQ